MIQKMVNRRTSKKRHYMYSVSVELQQYHPTHQGTKWSTVGVIQETVTVLAVNNIHALNKVFNYLNFNLRYSYIIVHSILRIHKLNYGYRYLYYDDGYF